MASKGKLLIVDDNPDLLTGLKIYLSPHFESVQTVRNPNLIPELIRKETYDVVLLDMNFSAGLHTGNEGIYWLHRILEMDPLVSVVLITAYGDVELAVRAMKEGATDFIQKSWEEEKILSTVLSALKIGQSRQEIQSLKQKQQHLTEKTDRDYQFCEPVSTAMQKVFETIRKAAPTEANILIIGENGTGKELVAREVHRQSNRAGDIFISIDLGSLPASLFESELFGYEKGAFTDAASAKPGRLELASRGTLFLDEIGNLPVSLQSKLLTVLQNRKISRLGSTAQKHIDVRLVCATNKDLKQMTRDGSFREDLMYRINTITVEVPPLRDRQGDLPLLADFFLRHFRDKYKKTIHAISRNALNELEGYSWPGNVRELQHMIEKAVILADGTELTPGDFDLQSGAHHAPYNQTFNLDENEKWLISKALQKYNGNISQVAKELGINRSTLYEKMKKYGLRSV